MLTYQQVNVIILNDKLFENFGLKGNNMKKTFITTNAIMLALILIFDVCYMIKGGLFFKSIASMLFVATGFINLAKI